MSEQKRTGSMLRLVVAPEDFLGRHDQTQMRVVGEQSTAGRIVVPANSTTETIFSPRRQMNKTKKKERGQVDVRLAELPTRMPLKLPQGSDELIRNIAAEAILEKMLHDKFHASDLEVSALMDLISRFPAICRQKYPFQFGDGRVRNVFPLTKLLCLQPPLPLLKQVCEANKRALSSAANSGVGDLPLHVLCFTHASLDVVEYIYSCNKEAISTPLEGNRYPLHLAIYSRAREEVIGYLIRTYPDAMFVQLSNNGYYALHLAVQFCAPVSVLEQLCKVWPESTMALNNMGQTPIHLACSTCKIHAEVVLLLQMANPDTLSIRDQYGRTPIQLAETYQSVDVIQLLLVVTNRLGAAQRGDTRTLHNATLCNSTETVRALGRAFPRLLLEKDQNGNTPLHIACGRSDVHQALHTARALVQLDATALSVQNNNGDRPLDVATRIKPDTKLVQMLRTEGLRNSTFLGRFMIPCAIRNRIAS